MGKNLLILCIGTTLVPEAVADNFFAFCGFAEFKTFIQILRKRYRNVVGFKGMQRNISFMKSRCG